MIVCFFWIEIRTFSEGTNSHPASIVYSNSEVNYFSALAPHRMSCMGYELLLLQCSSVQFIGVRPERISFFLIVCIASQFAGMGFFYQECVRQKVPMVSIFGRGTRNNKKFLASDPHNLALTAHIICFNSFCDAFATHGTRKGRFLFRVRSMS